MPIELRPVAIPDFGTPMAKPAIPSETYVARCEAAYAGTGCDWLVVYGDREHFANMVFLTGFEPRFEEALLLLGSGGRRVLVVGNENESYTAVSGLPGVEVVLSQSLSLMGQDRSRRPSLAAVLRECGISAGDSMGLVGWKYVEEGEWEGEQPGFFVPEFVSAILTRLTGSRPVEATPVLMHESTGLRSVVDADQIAAYEWAAARSSTALWRIVSGIRVGDSELLAASRMGYAGEPLNCHVMMTSGDASSTVLGLSSPSARIIDKGNGASSAVSYWGGLSSRAGLVTDHDEDFLRTTSAYFEGLLAWYRTADIGVEGGAIFAAVVDTLGNGGLGSALNPGHLTGHDEWTNTPIRPASSMRIRSGMPFQVDIIPVPMRTGWTLNCEDAVTFADAALRTELQRRHPEVFARIQARRAFMRDQLGVEISENILPMSSTPLCLPPFWLSPEKLLVQA